MSKGEELIEELAGITRKMHRLGLVTGFALGLGIGIILTTLAWSLLK